VNRNRVAVEEIREVYRRSGGKTPKLGLADLTALYESQLGDVNSLQDFRHTRVDLDPEAIVPRDVREKYAGLPSVIDIRGKQVEIQYDVEDSEQGPVGVARLRLPEKLARNMAREELPTLDRPLRFVVTRGARGAARGGTLEELQEELERPFTRDEIEHLEREHHARRDERRERKRRDHFGRDSSGGDAFARDDRKVPSDRSDGRRQKGSDFRKNRGGKGPGGFGSGGPKGRGASKGRRPR
jgi:ATP-dependent helicase HrpA